MAPLGAVTILASAGQDPARGPWGAGGASAFPRCRDLAGSSLQALACREGCFPFLSHSLLQSAPSPLAVCATCPCSSPKDHLWAQASLSTWLGGCGTCSLGHFSPSCCPQRASALHPRASGWFWGAPLAVCWWVGCPSRLMDPHPLHQGRGSQ